MKSFFEKIFYWFIVKWVSFTVHLYYSSIDVSGSENIPPDGVPTIFAGNHPNMITDAFLIGISSGRLDTHFWVKATAFRGLAGKFLRLVGGVPVMRKQDAAELKSGQNTDELFASSVQELASGDNFIIFPEGTSYTEPHMIPLKTGVAKVALAFQKQTGKPCTIVPVGINYLRKEKFRSAVTIEFGAPIFVTEEQFNSEDAVGITHQVEEAMHALTINAPDWRTVKLITTCRSLYLTSRSEKLTPSDYVHVSRAFTRLYAKYAESEPLVQLRSELEEYQTQLDNFNLPDAYFADRPDKHTGGALIFRLLMVALALTCAAPGLVIHSPLYLLLTYLSRRVPYVESKSMAKVVVLLFAVPALYSVVYMLILWRWGAWGVAGGLLVPGLAYLHIRALEGGLRSARTSLALLRLLALSLISSKHTDFILDKRRKLVQLLNDTVKEYNDKLQAEMVPVRNEESTVERVLKKIPSVGERMSERVSGLMRRLDRFDLDPEERYI